MTAGASDLTGEQAAQVEPLIRETSGERATAVLELFERFEHAHPSDPPHFFLTLLGTDPARQGEGLGLGLLGDTLDLIDAEHMPAYLEASNAGNVRLYERYGFTVRDSFQIPGSDLDVFTMWRHAR